MKLSLGKIWRNSATKTQTKTEDLNRIFRLSGRHAPELRYMKPGRRSERHVLIPRPTTRASLMETCQSLALRAMVFGTGSTPGGGPWWLSATMENNGDNGETTDSAVQNVYVLQLLSSGWLGELPFCSLSQSTVAGASASRELVHAQMVLWSPSSLARFFYVVSLRYRRLKLESW